MLDPRSGPFLFDTSAESWMMRARDPRVSEWWAAYLQHSPKHISSITVLERIRGYALLWRAAAPERRDAIEDARLAYLREPGYVWPVDAGISVVAGEIMAVLPNPPSPPRRMHRLVESRAERLARWRFDIIIAATALAAGMLLIHNNPADFEAIRGRIEQAPRRFPGLGPLQLIRSSAVVQ
jgi:predicted nucleic acid-binding protein